MRTDGSLGACACGRDASYASTQECSRCYKRRMAKRPRPFCAGCLLRRADFIEEGLCRACRAKRIAGYTDQVCKEDGCTQPLYVKAPLRGWCRKHWEESLQATVRRSQPLTEPMEWSTRAQREEIIKNFDGSKWKDLLEEATLAFLEDNHYMVDIGKASVAVREMNQ